MIDPRLLLINSDVCFRYRILSAVLALDLAGIGRQAAVCLVAKSPQVDEAGRLRSASERTIYRWLAAYADKGIPGLLKADRKSCQGSHVLPAKLLDFLATEREADRDASIPELLRRAELREVIASAQALDRSTVWRAMCRLGIETRLRKLPPDADQRRFRYPSRMQMVLADFKHFRAGACRARRAAMYLLDDSSRYGLDVLVTTSEQAEAVLQLLYLCIDLYGLMDLMYWDGGPGFRDGDVLWTCLRLGVLAIRGKAYYPEGHGAIERFNRSAKARVLRTLDGAPDVDPDCGALTLLLRHDLHEIYNHLPHEGLGGKTPHQCFHADPRPLRPTPSAEWLRERFTVALERRVSKDHIVGVDGTDYEVPRGHSGEKVQLQRRLLERTVERDALYLPHQDKLVRLHPVDLAANARDRRGPRPQNETEDVVPVPRKSASQLSFEQAYPCMLAPDGGYQDPQKENDNDETKDR